MKRITYLFLILFISCTAALGQGKAKYVFYFIGDGMGVNQVNTTEVYLSELQGNTVGVVPLQFTQFPVAGMATTFSATHSVTDSAAGGTALATGQKTYNGAIGVGTEYERITTIAERAKQSGKKVGIATSVSIDHATPASFYAHQTSRSKYYEIAMDIPASKFDFFAGGGFIRPTTSYEKKEMPSIYPILEEAGYTIARGYDDYKAKAASAKKMILMQQEGKDPGCIPYVLDRKEDDLTLPQITQSAIDFLMKDNKKGFFLMVEGGKIDWACHSNDAHTVVTEVIDMDEAVKIAFEFYKKHPRETLIVISADHETGGVAVGSSSHMTNFKAMQYQKQSLPALSDKIKELRKKKGHNTTWEEMKALLSETMGFWKELPMSWTHEKMLRDSFEESFSATANVIMVESMYAKSEPLAAKAKDVMNDIAHSYWTTTGHTAGYVPVYAIGVGSDMFKGKIDNTDIPNRIAKIAGYK